MKLTLLINDNDKLQLMHINPTGNNPNVMELWDSILQEKYNEPRVGVANLYGVEIDDYILDQPTLIGALKGHVRVHDFQF